MSQLLLCGALLAAFSPQLTPLRTRCSTRPSAARFCAVSASDNDHQKELSDEQIATIFGEFDTSGDGYIQLGELRAALAKAGKPISLEGAEDILARVDENMDNQISLDEFKSVFRDSALREDEALQGLFGVQSFFLNVGDALGIDVRGQWRTTATGARYVDDVLGTGKLITAGDIVQVHYTMTLMPTERVVESTRGGAPLGFAVSDAPSSVQGWNDATAGMRIGGQRRVYAKPSDGSDGPTVRYDIELVGLVEGKESSTKESVITSLGGRRAAFRLLFAASFAPYFLPDEYKPAFFQESQPGPPSGAVEVEVDKRDQYVSQQLDALFSNEELPKKGLRR